MENMKLNKKSRVGIVGIPPLEVIRQLNEAGTSILDLDEPLVKVDIETAAPHLPRVYCAILRTAVINALHLDLDAIYIDVGPGKCDCALHVSTILKDIVSIPVYPCKNTDTNGYGFPLSCTQMNLLEKFQKITRGVQSAEPHNLQKHAPCNPVAGFWGVPPRDFSLLELFPDRTHIYGWTRCMENKTPADTALESYFNPEVPTVFFAQSFCAKTALAKFLAAKHPKGLYLDTDVSCSSSAKAKIQAFLELSGVLYDLG